MTGDDGRLSLPLYLDYQATTPLDHRVLDAMMPYLTSKFGNPHSVSHKFGWEAEAAVDVAREQVARLIGADPAEIIFTSGATESNNMAIKGVAHAYAPARDHVVTVVTEHKCVLESCMALERQGFRVTYLPVAQNGLVDLGALRDAITERTALVSVMAVNNEIGVLQPIAEIGAIAREKNVLFHTDAAQAVGKIPLNVAEMNIALMSISGHKVYGPKGIGALFVRRRPRVAIEALISGGGQERGLRSGTLSPALCAGLGRACQIAGDDQAAELKRLQDLFTRFMSGIERNLNGVQLNGDRIARFPGNLNLSFDGVNGDLLIAELRNLAVSSGAACASASKEPSYVLRAIGVSDDMARASLRIGLGRFTSVAQVDFAVSEIVEKVRALRHI